jgi:hypothetical protein
MGECRCSRDGEQMLAIGKGQQLAPLRAVGVDAAPDREKVAPSRARADLILAPPGRD